MAKSIFNRPGVAGAVLQTPKSQTVRAWERKNVDPQQHITCHVSHVTCHVSYVTCNVSEFLFSGQSGEAYQWRVCY